MTDRRRHWWTELDGRSFCSRCFLERCGQNIEADCRWIPPEDRQDDPKALDEELLLAIRRRARDHRTDRGTIFWSSDDVWPAFRDRELLLAEVDRLRALVRART